MHRPDRHDGGERGAVAALEARLVLARARRGRQLERRGELFVPILRPPRERRARAEQLVSCKSGDLADAVVHVHDHASTVGQLVGDQHAVGDRVEDARSEVALGAHAAFGLETLRHVGHGEDDTLELALR